MNRLYIPSKPHPITMKTTTITPPSQAKELAEKQTKNPDFTRTFRKKLYICGAFAKQQCRL